MAHLHNTLKSESCLTVTRAVFSPKEVRLRESDQNHSVKSLVMFEGDLS